MAASSIKKNYIYNIFYEVLLMVLPLITSPYLTRVVGADGLGVYSFVQSYAHYFVLFIMLGLSNYGNREIARARDNKDGTAKTFWEIYTFQLICAIVCSVLYLSSIAFFVKENRHIYIIQHMYVISAGLDINWFFFGLEKFKLTVTRNSIIKIASAICVFLFVRKPDDVWIYTMIISGSLLLSQAILWPFLFKEIEFCKPTLKGVVSRIKPNLIMFIPVIAVSLYTVMDKLMLGVIGTKAEVGYYTYAERIVQIPVTFITALGTIMLPRASNLIMKGKEDENLKMMNKSMQFSMLFSIGSAFGLIAIANQFVPWYYGSYFTRCALLVIYLAPVNFITSWSKIIRTHYIIPKGMDRIYIYSVSSGALVNLIFNFILIRKYQGVGAVVATIMAQLAVCVIQYIYVHSMIDMKTYFKDSFVFCICGAIMLLLLKIIPPLSAHVIVDILTKVVIGAAVYFTMAFGYLNLIKKDTSLSDSAIAVFRGGFRRLHRGRK